MRVKLRNSDFDEFADVFVGYDKNGNEVFTGDIVTKNGDDYKVNLALELQYAPESQNLNNYTLKG